MVVFLSVNIESNTLSYGRSKTQNTHIHLCSIVHIGLFNVNHQGMGLTGRNVEFGSYHFYIKSISLVSRDNDRIAQFLSHLWLW